MSQRERRCLTKEALILANRPNLSWWEFHVIALICLCCDINAWYNLNARYLHQETYRKSLVVAFGTNIECL